MTDEGRAGRLEAGDEERWGDDPDWVELAVLADALRASEDEHRRLLDERLARFRRLEAKGCTPAAMARRSGLKSEMSVRFALNPALKAKRAPKKAAAKKSARAS